MIYRSASKRWFAHFGKTAAEFIVLFVVSGCVAVAQEHLIEAISGDGKYSARVTPTAVMEPCNSILYFYRADPGGKGELLFHRRLINERSPAEVAVTEDGQFVMTFDEMGNPGWLPVVIYTAGVYGRGVTHYFVREIYDILPRERKSHGSYIGIDGAIGSLPCVHWRMTSIITEIYFDKLSYICILPPVDSMIIIDVTGKRIIDTSSAKLLDERYLMVVRLCREKTVRVLSSMFDSNDPDKLIFAIVHAENLADRELISVCGKFRDDSRSGMWVVDRKPVALRIGETATRVLRAIGK